MRRVLFGKAAVGGALRGIEANLPDARPEPKSTQCKFPSANQQPGGGALVTCRVHACNPHPLLPFAMLSRWVRYLGCFVMTFNIEAGLAQLGERQTEVHFIITSEGHVFDPHKPHILLPPLTTFSFCPTQIACTSPLLLLEEELVLSFPPFSVHRLLHLLLLRQRLHDCLILPDLPVSSSFPPPLYSPTHPPTHHPLRSVL